MNHNRRGFLSLLASLPLVGALFGRADATSKTLEISPNAYDQLSYNAGHNNAIVELQKSWDFLGVRCIRWIPVAERLPPLPLGGRSANGFCLSESGKLLVATNYGVTTGRYFEWQSGIQSGKEWETAFGDIASEDGRGIRFEKPVVTHWSEMPAGPSE